ncbi:MAG: hypothetical protein PHQ52_07365 [Candidatus Omnitrophica bacterium]|nr:hypothetical protein [Candidatus Omnitrophota bacterium]
MKRRFNGGLGYLKKNSTKTHQKANAVYWLSSQDRSKVFLLA